MHISSANRSPSLERSFRHPCQRMLSELFRHATFLSWFRFNSREFSFQFLSHSIILLLKPIIVLILVNNHESPLVREQRCKVPCRSLRPIRAAFLLLFLYSLLRSFHQCLLDLWLFSLLFLRLQFFRLFAFALAFDPILLLIYWLIFYVIFAMIASFVLYFVSCLWRSLLFLLALFDSMMLILH